MGLLDPVSLNHTGTSDQKLKTASAAMESLVLKQVIKSSGAFQGSEVAGSAMVADLFADTLADAVAKSGGMGLADSLHQELAPKTSPQGASPGTANLASLPPATGGLASSAIGHRTSGFGVRLDPWTGEPKDHHGVDLAAPEGTTIRSALPGVVVQAGPRGGYGNAVEVDNGNGVHTLYAHASSVDVKVGQEVPAGTTLAEVGQTGRATGPHLHFEVRVQGRAVDPDRALKTYGRRAEEILGGNH
jgi:murein DD-endopeptidase MepM/ murein hydrolase activator NlpD